MKNKQIRNAAEIHNVKEMTLVCTAGIAVWQDYLKTFGIVPVEYNGMAKILISVTEMKFLKIRFREFVISVFVTGKDPESEAAFLLLAYNSNKFFSWSERNFFSTPYHHGRISFDHQNYSGADVITSNNNIISINNSINNSRLPKFEGDDKWEGRVYLPYNYIKKENRYKWFYAGVSGDTKKYEYSKTEDELVLNNMAPDKVFECLNKSNIAGYEWIIRDNATHSKSKTHTS